MKPPTLVNQHRTAARQQPGGQHHADRDSRIDFALSGTDLHRRVEDLDQISRIDHPSPDGQHGGHAYRGNKGNFCQMTDQPAGLCVRLRCRDNSYIAQLCAGCRSLKTNDYPMHPALSFSGNRLKTNPLMLTVKKDPPLRVGMTQCASLSFRAQREIFKFKRLPSAQAFRQPLRGCTRSYLYAKGRSISWIIAI